MPRPRKNTVELMTADRVMQITATLANYAVEHLSDLIIDGDSKQVIWADAFNILQQKIKEGAPYSHELIADVLEEFVDGYDYATLDKIIDALPSRMRFVILVFGIPPAKTTLAMNPQWKRELREKGEGIMLQALLSNPAANRAYTILKARPKIRRFLMNYILLKLGVEPIR